MILLKRIQSNIKGAFMISFLGLLPILLGLAALVVDFGRVHLARVEMDSLTSSAAQQGALFLPDEAKAKQVASSVWGVRTQSSSVFPVPLLPTITTTPTSMQISTQANVRLFIAPIFGLAQSDLVSSAAIQTE